MHKTTYQKLFVFLIILGVLIPSREAFSQNELATVENQIYLPLVINKYPPELLTNMWVGNVSGYERSAYLPGEEIRYITVGDNSSDHQIRVDLQWNQVGPCGAAQIFSGTLTLDPGIWVNSIPKTAPHCLGTYTNTVKLTYENSTDIQITTFEVVIYTSEVVVSTQQGFDKCGLPTVEQMQAWSSGISPYDVFNIYLGGSNFACDNPQLNADWVWQVSQQGWDFILTWVGPQSPCFSTVKPKISLDTGVAYQQGQDEADLAIDMADNLGLTGDRIIYYDIEGYADSDTKSCSKAVDSFLTGWTARLHARGFKAGAYGSPCRSFISTWWDNQPRLDDIWIARWLLPAEYRPVVDVFGEICGLTDAMWANNQRLRQYAGDHNEVWGGISLGSIDSNILLGEITAITTTTQTSAATSTSADSLLVDSRLREVQLLTPDTGWVLKGNQFLLTRDAGQSWQTITPPGIETILSIDFPDVKNGWLVSLNNLGELILHQTRDGGTTWQASPLPFSSLEVGAVYLDFLNAQAGWVVQKMASSSNFSIGRLYATQDGGHTWEERSIPLGEPVQFSDLLNGWVAGGPAENEFYRTENGGWNWTTVNEQEYLTASLAFDPTSPQNPPENTVQVSGTDTENAWALTQNGSCSGEKSPSSANAEPFRCWQQTQLWSTSDGGLTWQEVSVK